MDERAGAVQEDRCPPAGDQRPRPGRQRVLIADNHETGGACLDWLTRVLPGLVDRAGRPDFEATTRLAAEALPGASAVMFTPWLRGERSPVDDRHARAGFHNLSLTTGRADLCRAVLEGVAFNNRWLHDAVERSPGAGSIRYASSAAGPSRTCGARSTPMCWTGSSSAWTPLCWPTCVGRPSSPGWPSAPSRPRRCRDLVGVERVFRPDPAHRATFDHLYAQFPKLYRAQRGSSAGSTGTARPVGRRRGGVATDEDPEHAIGCGLGSRRPAVGAAVTGLATMAVGATGRSTGVGPAEGVR